MITQPCPSINSWGHRDPERRVKSHRFHSIFSRNSQYPLSTTRHRLAPRRVWQGRSHGPPASCMLPHTRQMLEDTAASKSHGGGGKCSLIERLQEAPAGCSHLSRQNPTPAIPIPPTGLRGQSRTLYIFPQERSAGLVLARDIETHVQGQDKVLWAANVSQAPRSFSSLGLRFHIRKARSWARRVALGLQFMFSGSRSQ